MPSPKIEIRVDEATKARWVYAAMGIPLGTFVKECVEQRIDLDNALAGGGVEGGSDRAVAAAGATPAASAKLKPTRGKRSAKKANVETVAAVNRGMCEHRIPADRYCSRCDP